MSQMESLLSLTNPTMKAFAFYGTLVIVKMFGVAILTVKSRGGKVCSILTRYFLIQIILDMFLCDIITAILI